MSKANLKFFSVLMISTILLYQNCGSGFKTIDQPAVNSSQYVGAGTGTAGGSRQRKIESIQKSYWTVAESERPVALSFAVDDSSGNVSIAANSALNAESTVEIQLLNQEIPLDNLSLKADHLQIELSGARIQLRRMQY